MKMPLSPCSHDLAGVIQFARRTIGIAPLLLGATLTLVLGAPALRAADIEFQPRIDFLQLPQGYELGRCSAVAPNSRGEIFLLHRGKHPVICVDAAGKFLRSWDSDLLTTPHGLRVDPQDNVWVTDIGQHRVLKFDPQGKLLLALGNGKAGTAADQFDQPTDIAFAADGSVFITDGYGNSRVLKFTADGKLIKMWGSKGQGAGEFHVPHSIVIDRQGRLLVADRENKRIQMFDQEGKALGQWSGFAPYGLTLDATGQLFVSDGVAHEILRLDGEGRIVQRWGKQGKAAGEFDVPHMLSFDRDGNLWISEVFNLRFQKFVRKTK